MMDKSKFAQFLKQNYSIASFNAFDFTLTNVLLFLSHLTRNV